MLDVLLALDRIARGGVNFIPDQMFDAVSAGEAFDRFFAMFRDTANDVASDTCVERPIPAACKNVDIEFPHQPSARPWVAGSSPAKTGVFAASVPRDDMLRLRPGSGSRPGNDASGRIDSDMDLLRRI